MSEIKLGVRAKDKVSGYTGIIVTLSEVFNGNVRVSLQPIAVDNKYEDGFDFDLAQCEYVDEGVSDIAKEMQTSDLELGQEVEHVYTGMKGMAIQRTWFLNGCLYYKIVSKVNKENKTEEQYIDHLLLKPTSKKEVVAAPQTKTGGPVTRAIRV